MYSMAPPESEVGFSLTAHRAGHTHFSQHNAVRVRHMGFLRFLPGCILAPKAYLLTRIALQHKTYKNLA